MAMLSLYVEVTFYTLVYHSFDSDNDFRFAVILKLNPRYKYFQIFDFLVARFYRGSDIIRAAHGASPDVW